MAYTVIYNDDSLSCNLFYYVNGLECIDTCSSTFNKKVNYWGSNYISNYIGDELFDQSLSSDYYHTWITLLHDKWGKQIYIVFSNENALSLKNLRTFFVSSKKFKHYGLYSEKQFNNGRQCDYNIIIVQPLENIPKRSSTPLLLSLF